MPRTSLFESDLSLDSDYIELYGIDLIKPGIVFTMKYTQTTYNICKDATVRVTLVNIDHMIEDEYLDVTLYGCVLQPETPIDICAHGAYMSRDITLYTDATNVATLVAYGHVLKIFTS